MKTTLVTGAAGFAGSHLLDQLAADEPAGTVVAWHRLARGDGPPGVRWQAVDMLDRSAVSAAIAETRPAVVFHCAGAAHVQRASAGAEAAFAINVRGTQFLLDALAVNNVPCRVLVPSSAMVYQPSARAHTEGDPLVPPNAYGLSKLAQEMLAARASTNGISVGIARAFNHVGPRQDPSFVVSDFARQIARIEAGAAPPEMVVGNLEAQRELTDVRDTVRAYRAVVDRGQPGRPYNISSGRAFAIGELLERLLTRARVPITVRTDPARFRANDVTILVGDPSRIREELGWAPQISLDRTLDDVLEYWRRA
ncbi:MAG TPA: GDP-mannose 4,6-dehydratase [Vicinamibacterales bacterium]|nr:GDP-mannose 4,6-dehydratase [Vicinamibacterales bacterium]